MSMYELIVHKIATILSERGDSTPALTPETRISASGLDSLDIAALIVRLEEQLGFDPFSAGTLDRYPQTLGEMADLYASSNSNIAKSALVEDQR